MKNKKVLVIVIAIFVFTLCGWRLWPQSLNDILSLRENAFTKITVKVSEFGIINNSPTIDGYSLEIVSPEDNNYSAIMSILESTKFYPDFRNLLPWDVLTVDSGRKNITHSAHIMLTWGDTNNDVCYVSFHGERIVSFDISGNTEFLVYHPTNRTVLEQIATYTMENGEKQ